ncbi:MAG: hypothetical protein HRF46_13000 [Acidobacteriota bacterium]|jgi:hypothetical protein
MGGSHSLACPAQLESLEQLAATERDATTPELKQRLAEMNAQELDELDEYRRQLSHAVEEGSDSLIKEHEFFSSTINGSFVNGREGKSHLATGRLRKRLAASLLTALIPTAAAISDGLSAYAQQAPDTQTIDGVTAENPVHRTVASTPRRHLGRPAPDPITRADYVVPLEGDNREVRLVLANVDPNVVNVKVYTDADKVHPQQLVLAPGESKTLVPAGGLAGFITVEGASDAANVIGIARHAHVVNGKAVSETVPFVPVGHAALGVERSYAPAPLVPGRLGEAGTTAQGYWLCSVDHNTGSEVGLAHNSGTIYPDHVTRHFLAPWSVVYVPDVLAELNVVGISKGQLLFQPTAPGIIAVTTLRENNSGDHSTLMALSKRLAEDKFTMPIIRHLTSGPFAQYTDISVINPDASPLQQYFGAAYQPRGVSGTPTDSGGRQLFALTHYLFDDAIQTFFGHNDNPPDMEGSAPGHNEATMLVWNRIRTAMPHGDVGAAYPVIHYRDMCGTKNEYQCNLIGLDGNATIGLHNRSPVPTTVKLEAITDAGIIASTQHVTLGTYENRELEGVIPSNLTNARVRLTVIRSGVYGDDSIDRFAAWATTPGADGDEDYQAAKQVPGSLADAVDRYITFWKPNANYQFWVSNTEYRRMINGSSKTPSFLDPLVDAIYNGSSNTPPPKAIIRASLIEEVNGIYDPRTDSELITDADPVVLVPAVPSMDRLIQPDGGALRIRLTVSGEQNVRAVFLEALRAQILAFPGEYGVAVGVAPADGRNPTWTTQDLN